MSRARCGVAVLLAAAALQSLLILGCALEAGERKATSTLFIGVDTSGSFQGSGLHDDAMSFLAHYIYGHLNGLGGLEVPREMFVAAVGGEEADEPKAFHPIQAFAGKGIQEIEQTLRESFSPNDALTDFNPFFRQVARIVKERNLDLAPVTNMIGTDGVPDFSVGGAPSGADPLYERIDVSSLEYLSRRMTVRLAYVSPKVGESWRELVPRQRVRLWTVDGEVMRGWRQQLGSAQDPREMAPLWKWIQHNVDYRVRSLGA